MTPSSFVLRDLAVSCEVEAYQQLSPLQGTKVPQIYGYFAAAAPTQQGRTVYITGILLEEVPGQGPARHCASGCYRECLRQA